MSKRKTAIPQFKSVEEESDFYDRHSLTEFETRPVTMEEVIAESRARAQKCKMTLERKRENSMPIDGCRYTFAQLANDVLPGYMAELLRRMAQPTPMSAFAIEGVGVAALLAQFDLNNDFTGCYVLIDGTDPIYVGISRTVLQRLRQHVRGTTHFDASLAYRIAAANQPHGMTRHAAMSDGEFRQHFAAAQMYIRGLNVAFIEIQNPVELYLFEVFCAMELDTSVWNTFETH